MPDSPSNKLTEDSQSLSNNASARENIQATAIVPPELAGKRFDVIAAQLFPDYSRGRLQQWIESGQLTADDKTAKTRQKLKTGQRLSIDAEFEVETSWQPQPMPLDIVYEDEHVLVINKPDNCVVHPAPGLSSGTLANAILAHCPNNAELPRCGIIHRLDKDTTGLLVVAKSLVAHADLVGQLQARSVKRIYRAIACGKLISGGTVDAPIGRHPGQRTKMAVAQPLKKNTASNVSGAKPAVTHYRINARYSDYTELFVQLETGRTHQIRVHMAHIRHPLLGDATYNPRYRRPQGISDELDAVLRRFNRQALHATTLGFFHPDTGEECEFNVDPPRDYLRLIEALKETIIPQR